MNKLQNGVSLIGRSGINPIIRTFENGIKLAKFSLATNETVMDAEGKSVKTQWHQIVAWGKKAELIEKFVKKGQLMAVDGKIIYRNFTDNNGKNKKITEVQVTNIMLINKQKEEARVPVKKVTKKAAMKKAS